eukprot:359181-Amorphochlora_amoeboformis.AAC.1
MDAESKIHYLPNPSTKNHRNAIADTSIQILKIVPDPFDANPFTDNAPATDPAPATDNPNDNGTNAVRAGP